jgi:hypothetical protein
MTIELYVLWLSLLLPQTCMKTGQLKIAASYLLVLHNLEPLEQSSRVSYSLTRPQILLPY